MTRIDQTMIAEIGTWQDFPPRSGLRRTLAALAATRRRVDIDAAASAARWPTSTTACSAISA